MKVLISERQLKRLIREFQDIYDNGIDRLSAEIEKEIKAGGYEMKDDTWTEKREKESFRLLKMLNKKVVKFLIDYFNLEEGKLVNQINELVNKLFVLSMFRNHEQKKSISNSHAF